MKFTRRNAIKIAGAGVSVGLAGCSGLLSSNQTDQTIANKPIRNKNYRVKKLYHGVAYYPELWPLENIDQDIIEMKKVGINVVRMAEFAWATMESNEGKIDLNLFKMVMDKMHQANIDVILCTPTATPPIWLTHNHPERCHKNADGEIMSHGARQHASYEHPDVRKVSFTIINAMAKELGGHPALIAWQLDNEMKAHVAEDFSDAAVNNWHQWLKQRFGTIKRLNMAWGTKIWSQHYQKFDQVPAPVKTPFLHSASLSTAYKMFCRESVADFMKAQRDVICRHSVCPITHNDNPAFNIHHERSMQALDFASYDAYPTDRQWQALVFRSDLYRAAIPGRAFWLMETSVSHNGWLGNHQPPHSPSFLNAEAILAYSLGGEAFCYWLWRQQRTGAELAHSAVMSAWNTPSIGYNEVKKLNVERKKLEPILINTQVLTPEIAVTYSDHARAMIETEELDKRKDFPKRYRGVIEMWHAKLMNLGYHREVRFENAELDGLKVLITPAMPYVSAEFITRALAFVEQGGTWIAGPVTGTRGKEHNVPTTAGLGLLDKLAGVETKFVVPLTHTGAQGTAFGITTELSGWCAAMTAKVGTKVIGSIDSGVAKDNAFITERNIGKGRVVILGVQPFGDKADEFLSTMISHYADKAGVTERYQVTKGTIVAPRINEQGDKFWVAINMDGQGGQLILPKGAVDARNNRVIEDHSLNLSPYEWRAIYLNI